MLVFLIAPNLFTCTPLVYISNQNRLAMGTFGNDYFIIGPQHFQNVLADRHDPVLGAFGLVDEKHTPFGVYLPQAQSRSSERRSPQGYIRLSMVRCLTSQVIRDGFPSLWHLYFFQTQQASLPL
jgi:hypothetical protein